MSTPRTTGPQCGRCHRTLTSAASIRAGYGRWCLARKRTEDLLAEFTEAQVEKACELIADGGLVCLRRGVYLAVSTDGTTTYRTSAKVCNCPAGLRGLRCYHRAAVRIVTTPRIRTRRMVALAA